MSSSQAISNCQRDRILELCCQPGFPGAIEGLVAKRLPEPIKVLSLFLQVFLREFETDVLTQGLGCGTEVRSATKSLVGGRATLASTELRECEVACNLEDPGPDGMA